MRGGISRAGGRRHHAPGRRVAAPAMRLAAVAAALVACVGAPVASQAAGVAAPAPVPARGEVQRFGVAWQGVTLPLWYVRPANAAADAPVVFVFHGVRRDADRYIAEWVDLARAAGVIVAVPEFGSRDFPGARSYNHGNLFDAGGRPVPRERWTYSALEPLFDALVARERLTATGYSVFGHSAGAQFVHRLVLTGGAPRLRQAIAANAGSYSFPDADVAWPFGTGGLAEGVWAPVRAYAVPMTILLGTADNDPDYPSLPRDPAAMAQGPHRLARGIAFYGAARADAAARGAAFDWSCLLVPGVGHDNGRMAPAALGVLTGRIAAPAGADCRPVPGPR